jgi:hypothetical protein
MQSLGPAKRDWLSHQLCESFLLDTRRVRVEGQTPPEHT